MVEFEKDESGILRRELAWCADRTVGGGELKPAVSTKGKVERS